MSDGLTARRVRGPGDERPPPDDRGRRHARPGPIRARLLLIASTDAGKRKVDEAYRSRIGDNATFWYVPDAGHTKALSAHPGAYAARVSAFLATALATR